MKNFDKNFYKGRDSFLAKLEPSSNDYMIIHDAIGKIKIALQKGISQEYKKSPRFMTQGSARYKTLNKPCIIPPQQMDYDIGCYLPLSEHMNEDNPIIAENIFFKIADRILADLVKKRNWQSYSKEKDTCCRVEINEKIHIDIPLYSVPDEEFNTIKDRIIKCSESYQFSRLVEDTQREPSWDDFKFTEVLLAHRKIGWKKSDPRDLNMHFENVARTKGPQIIRLFRYMKAFRDKQWITKGPSSIFLMCVIDRVILAMNKNGDALAFLQVLEEFSNLSSRHVENPTDTAERISISSEDYNTLKTVSHVFCTDLKEAIYNQTLSGMEACNLIRKHLGDRFPVKDNQDDDEISREQVLSITGTPQEKESIPLRTHAG